MSEPAHDKIIKQIHKRRGVPFAVRDISLDGTHRVTAHRILDTLILIKLVAKYQKSYMNRRYQTTKRWPEDPQEVIKLYELLKASKR